MACVSTGTRVQPNSAKTAAALSAQNRAEPPAARGLPLLGNVLDAWRDPMELFRKVHREHGDYVRLRFGVYRYLLVNDPDGVRRVLVDNHKNYKKSISYEGLRLVLGDGLLTSEGEFWRRQRRLAQPAFHKEKLSVFLNTMVSDTQAMLERWSKEDDGAPFDLHEEMMRVTLSIASRTLFSTDTSDAAKAVAEALPVAMRYTRDYAEAVVRVPSWLPTPKNLRFKRALSTLDNLVLGIIEARRSQQASDDLLAMLMSAEDEETREQMTDQQLRNEVMTLLLAGHETTANALSWTFHLLAQHPEVARRLRAEADAVLGEHSPTLEHLPRLKLNRMVLEESMRLYPPAWVFEREAIADDEIGGFRVPAGTIIAISPYTLHRNPRFWNAPEAFDPERFEAQNAASRPKYAYLPFGGGQRICIGNAFAMMEAQLILSMLSRSYEFNAAPGFSVDPEPSVTLRPRSGLFMLRARRGDAA